MGWTGNTELAETGAGCSGPSLLGILVWKTRCAALGWWWHRGKGLGNHTALAPTRCPQEPGTAPARQTAEEQPLGVQGARNDRRHSYSQGTSPEAVASHHESPPLIPGVPSEEQAPISQWASQNLCQRKSLRLSVAVGDAAHLLEPLRPSFPTCLPFSPGPPAALENQTPHPLPWKLVTPKQDELKDVTPWMKKKEVGGGVLCKGTQAELIINS